MNYILIKKHLYQENPNDSCGYEDCTNGLHGGDFLLQADGADDEGEYDAHVAGGGDESWIFGDGEGVEDNHVIGLGDETDGEDAHIT